MRHNTDGDKVSTRLYLVLFIILCCLLHLMQECNYGTQGNEKTA